MVVVDYRPEFGVLLLEGLHLKALIAVLFKVFSRSVYARSKMIIINLLKTTNLTYLRTLLTHTRTPQVGLQDLCQLGSDF